jgi:flagellar hook-associated protein 1 FlgK
LSDVFGISLSALQAFQQALAVTSNNIANANTPGYDVETANLTAAVPQSYGQAAIGNGVDVASVSRAFSQTAENQLYSSQSSLGQLNALQTYSSQIDDIVGSTGGGLTTALRSYYGAWSTLASDPSSTASRQAVLSAAQGLAQSFQSTGSQLQNLSNNINTGIAADVNQINSIASSITSLNQQIVVGTAQAGGQAPNTLLDQRDQLVSNLSQLVGVTTTTDADGAMNVFVGNGQPLVLDGYTTQLTTVANPYNATQLEVSTSTDGTNTISGSITTGDLGGLLAARSQVVNPAINQVGQIALALQQNANSLQNSGLDANGNFGANLFSATGPTVSASSNNTDAATAAATITNVGALTADNYVLSYKAGAYSLTDATSGATVALTGAGTAANPLLAASVGLAIVVTPAVPAAGDSFLISPTSQAAGSFAVALTSTSQLAAAGAIVTAAADANTGTATISAGTVTNAANPNLLAAATIAFTSPTTYTINGGAANAYTSGGNIAADGWQVQISGTPATGDVFTVQGNVGGTGDNRNALAAAAAQSQGVLSNGTISVNAAVSGLITGVGSQAQQINTSQTAQTAVNTQAQSAVQSVSGVNLDTEAANLLQWQQAYQAAAQVISTGNSLFTYLLDSINGTYT